MIINKYRGKYKKKFIANYYNNLLKQTACE